MQGVVVVAFTLVPVVRAVRQTTKGWGCSLERKCPRIIYAKFIHRSLLRAFPIHLQLCLYNSRYKIVCIGRYIVHTSITRETQRERERESLSSPSTHSHMHNTPKCKMRNTKCKMSVPAVSLSASFSSLYVHRFSKYVYASCAESNRRRFRMGTRLTRILRESKKPVQVHPIGNQHRDEHSQV